MEATPRPVTWTTRALTDVQRIYEWIAESAPRTAERYIADLVTKGDLLALNPHRGHAVNGPHLPHGNPFRSISFKSHRIIHVVLRDRLVIVTVVHKRRDIPHLLKWIRIDDFDH